MNFLNRFFLCAVGGILVMTASALAQAHEEGDYRPVYLSYKYVLEGDLYDRLNEEFKAEWDATDAALRDNPIYGIHSVDLNHDGVDELIVRLADQYTTCNDIGCHHAVLSVTDSSIKRLAYFEYSEMDIAATETKGVKDLLIYNDPLNDFSPLTYKWDDKSQMYQQE